MDLGNMLLFGGAPDVYGDLLARYSSKRATKSIETETRPV